MNSRIDRVIGFEQHFIRGKAKLEARVTLCLVVLLAMARGRIRAKQPKLTLAHRFGLSRRLTPIPIAAVDD